MSQVIRRPFNPNSDSGFIFSTMPKGVFYASFAKIPNRDIFFTTFYSYLQDLLKHAQVLIACMKNDQEVIIGYAILDKAQLEWIYVKESYRNQAIAGLMLKNKLITAVNPQNITVVGHDILKNHPNLFKPVNTAKIEQELKDPLEEIRPAEPQKEQTQ